MSVTTTIYNAKEIIIHNDYPLSYHQSPKGATDRRQGCRSSSPACGLISPSGFGGIFADNHISFYKIWSDLFDFWPERDTHLEGAE